MIKVAFSTIQNEHKGGKKCDRYTSHARVPPQNPAEE